MEADRSLWVQGQTAGLNSEFQETREYIETVSKKGEGIEYRHSIINDFPPCFDKIPNTERREWFFSHCLISQSIMSWWGGHGNRSGCHLKQQRCKAAGSHLDASESRRGGNVRAHLAFFLFTSYSFRGSIPWDNAIHIRGWSLPLHQFSLEIPLHTYPKLCLINACLKFLAPIKLTLKTDHHK